MHDPLIDAVLAAPSDDAPRLVWADREGGERGELVVVQCALARDGANERLRRRAAELLAANAHAWSGLPPMGHERADPMFVRGFMEGLRIDLDALAEHGAAVFANMPFLRVLLVDATAPRVERRLPRSDLARTEVLDAALASLAGVRLRALSISPVSVDLVVDGHALGTRRDGSELLRKLTQIPALASLESLRMPASGISYVESLHPLRVFPGLKSIVLSETRIDPARARAAFSLLPQLESIRINRIELTR